MPHWACRSDSRVYRKDQHRGKNDRVITTGVEISGRVLACEGKHDDRAIRCYKWAILRRGQRGMGHKVNFSDRGAHQAIRGDLEEAAQLLGGKIGSILQA